MGGGVLITAIITVGGLIAIALIALATLISHYLEIQAKRDGIITEAAKSRKAELVQTHPTYPSYQRGNLP